MKVILLKDVPKLGQRGTIKNVSDGYALNMLLPRGMAEKATPEKMAALESKTAAAQDAKTAHEEALFGALAMLKGTPLEISVPANEQGHLYKQVSSEEIAQAFSTKTNTPLNAQAISIAAPIKEAGEYDVTLTIGEKRASLSLLIVAQ